MENNINLKRCIFCLKDDKSLNSFKEDLDLAKKYEFAFNIPIKNEIMRGNDRYICIKCKEMTKDYEIIKLIAISSSNLLKKISHKQPDQDEINVALPSMPRL
ncbi:hypothetical protein PVAND_013913 [Polypedilum vanderplanki]|uniref:Uncharacterized protein n=1 Tax=Polypedilum vanderplanki TaxID=319348 RepID=A0A9J6CSY6_POLVA|nr:hypothetical protein PVAND_013913 [Polypedilum vanderplanki]